MIMQAALSVGTPLQLTVLLEGPSEELPEATSGPQVFCLTLWSNAYAMSMVSVFFLIPENKIGFFKIPQNNFRIYQSCGWQDIIFWFTHFDFDFTNLLMLENGSVLWLSSLIMRWGPNSLGAGLLNKHLLLYDPACPRISYSDSSLGVVESQATGD